MSKRRKLSAEFKHGAVEQTKQSGVSCAQVARCAVLSPTRPGIEFQQLAAVRLENLEGQSAEHPDVQVVCFRSVGRGD